MNGFFIILTISILSEIVIYFNTIKYIKKFLNTNKLEQLYEFYKENDLEKDKRTIFTNETSDSLNSSKISLSLSIIAAIFAIYMNQGNYLVYILGFLLVFVSTIKYILIKKYVYSTFSKINFN